MEHSQSWQTDSHLQGNTVEGPVANNHSLLPDLNKTYSSTTTSQDKANTYGTAVADGNVDSVTQQLMCNVSNKWTSSPLLELNR